MPAILTLTQTLTLGKETAAVLAGLQRKIMLEICRRSVYAGGLLGLSAIDGARVVIRDLGSNVEMNGRHGSVVSYHPEIDRYSVLLDGIEGLFDLKMKNLIEEEGAYIQEEGAS